MSGEGIPHKNKILLCVTAIIANKKVQKMFDLCFKAKKVNIRFKII